MTGAHRRGGESSHGLSEHRLTITAELCEICSTCLNDLPVCAWRQRANSLMGNVTVTPRGFMGNEVVFF